MFKISLDFSGVDREEAEAYVQELQNVYADLEVYDVTASGTKISFSAGFSGMDDTSPEDIRSRLDEYLTMNEAFSVDAGPIIIEPL